MTWGTARWDEAQLKSLRDFIEERESIRLKKESGLPFPWTENPLLQKYHWCNCHQQHDRVSRWIAKNWRDANAGDPDLWFAVLVARRATNHPETMQDLGYPVPWDSERFLSVVRDRSKSDAKIYHTPAYRLVLNTRSAGSIAERLERSVLTPMWSNREHFRPRKRDTLASFHSRLASAKYIGQFYAGQVVADLKHVQLRDASDWWDFAVPGPGSARGLNRLLGLLVQYASPNSCSSWSPSKQQEWHSRMLELRAIAGLKDWELQDVQATLCEFDKYQRLLLRDGHYARRYTAGAMRHQSRKTHLRKPSHS